MKLVGLLISSLLLFLSFGVDIFAAGVTIPGGTVIEDVSIGVNASGGSPEEVVRTFGYTALSLVKLIVSGFALVYLVLIGVYMVIFSENEERIKTQRRQFVYALVGFLFLNVPGMLYDVFFSTSSSKGGISDPSSTWNSISSVLFYNDSALRPLLTGFMTFFEVFIFGIAVLLFTWGFFLMILSGGDEERVKNGRNRIIYGVLGLIFLGFSRVWGRVIAEGDFGSTASGVWTISRQLIGIAVYFAGPVAIFFLVIGAYYYIMSGGDEEKAKKGKNIIINTAIATLILLASYSFLTELLDLTIS